MRGYLSGSGIVVSNVAMILEKAYFYYHRLAAAAAFSNIVISMKALLRTMKMTRLDII